MNRSELNRLLEKLRKKLRVEDRFADMGAQLRVYRRGKRRAVKAELLSRVYGGVYDRLHRRYVGPPTKIEEISCHAGQVPLLTFDEPYVARVLALGAPGGGKTFAIVRRALLNCLDRPNSIGGIVAPTDERRQIVWRDFLELVQPFGWVEDVRESKKEIVLINRAVVQVLAAKRPSVQAGSPLQGRSWDWCCVDESQNVAPDAQVEIDTRGRRAGTKYVVYEAATNSPVPSFKIRLEQYRANEKAHRILRYSGQENPWVDPEYWERLKERMTEREYQELILAQDVAPELLVYGRFNFRENVQPRPQLGRDVTAQITLEKYGRGYKYIAATDFGALTTTSIILKAYAGKGGDRIWWAIDEFMSYQTTSDIHARKLLSRYAAEDLIVICDPHFNSKDADKSDMHLMVQEGLHVVPAVHGKIARKHRLSMMNTLFEDARGVRRLFIDCDEKTKTPACPRFAEACMSLQYNEYGEAEKDKKDKNDRTHTPAAVGYGVFPWESFRGAGVQVVPIVKKTAEQMALERMAAKGVR